MNSPPVAAIRGDDDGVWKPDGGESESSGGGERERFDAVTRGVCFHRAVLSPF